MQAACGAVWGLAWVRGRLRGHRAATARHKPEWQPEQGVPPPALRPLGWDPGCARCRAGGPYPHRPVQVQR